MSYKILDVKYELSLCLSAWWFEVGVIWGEPLNLFWPGLFFILATGEGFEGPLLLKTVHETSTEITQNNHFQNLTFLPKIDLMTLIDVIMTSC